MSTAQEQDYSAMVATLAKPGADIVSQLTPEMAHLLHMAIGICGEAGELIDAIKKAAIYRKPIDRENAIEELGDLEWYMEGMRQGLSVTRSEVLAANQQKLAKRYAGLRYTDQQAHDRADKVQA